MKNKKNVIAIISIVAVLLVIIGITYAYWLVTRTQTNQNIISSGCLDISLTGEKNDITLIDQFPLSDEDGMELTPYGFTVTNNCTTSVDYQVNLESVGDSTTAIKASAIKVALNDEIKLLTSGGNVEPTVSGAYESNMILYGTLAARGSENASITYELRIWIDKDAPISEQNKTFRSKISVTVGQGIFNPYQEGTLAYDILSNYGGANAITSLSAEWTEGNASTVTASSTYVGTSSNWYGTTYEFDKETGKYKLSGTLTQATITECRNGTKTCGKYTFKTADKDYSYTTIYEITKWTNENGTNYVTAKTIKAHNAFSTPPTASDAGLYKTTDDLGTSYYFRGAPTNNYVKFGTYAKDTTITLTVYDYGTWETKEVSITAGTPMYWRIVRINGDGTIRMIYDGTSPVENGVSHAATIGATAYNTNEDNEKYLGYTYDVNGTETDSAIKGVVDKWYDDHLETTYGKYIADSIFCNDREIAGYTYYDDSWTEITDPNQALYTNTYYGPYGRLEDNKAPKLTCTNKSDRYTTSDKKGNGLLSNPVGLLTADEVFLAGGIMRGATTCNATYYLYNNELYWTSAPDYFDGDLELAFAWFVNYDGCVNDSSIGYDSPGARPVINLKANVKFTGDGRIDTNTPYEIVMN